MVGIVAEDATASEPGQDTGLFRVSMSEFRSTETQVNYQIGGSASNGQDYFPLSGAVIIPPNSQSATIPVQVIDDQLLEGTETVVITLLGTNNPTDVVDKTPATVNIADDDVNRPPMVTTNTGSTVAEGGADVITSSELITTDLDTPASGLTYTVTDLPDNGFLRREFPTGSFTTLALNGTFTQEDINLGRISYVHNGSETTSDAFRFSVSDGITTLPNNIFTFTVTPVNDAPTVVNPIPDTTVPEESSPTTINIAGVFSDPEGQPLTFTVSSSNSAVANATVSGNTLTLTYSPNQPGTATITVTATDPGGAQGQDAFQAKVTNTNDPPVAADDIYTTQENQALTVGPPGVMANDVDPDNVDGDPQNDTLTAALLSSTKNGTLSFLASGGFTYTPNPDFDGGDEFTYRVFDGKGSFDDAKVTINVTNRNRNPVAGDDKFSTLRNTPVTGNVLGNDSDPDGDAPLFASLQRAPANGSVVLQSNGNFSYTPNASFVGPDTFEYLLSDGQGGTDVGLVTITVMAGANLDAADDTFTRPEDTVVTGNLLANDIDPDGDSFSLISTTPPSSGSLTTDANGNFTYTPLANFFGIDSFTYTIRDAKGFTDTAKVTLTFTPVNDVDARDDTYSTPPGTTLNIQAPGVLLNDGDPDTNAEHQFPIGGVVPFSGASSKNGTLTVNSNGSFSYTPAPGFSGVDSFKYTITDAAGASDTALVTINVVAPNSPPNAVDDAASADPSQSVQINVLTNDTDPDGDKLTVVGVGSAANGQASIGAGGVITYQPNPEFAGVDSFTYTISDGRGGTDSATVRVIVTGDDLIARNDSFTVNEDTIRNPLDVLFNDSDPQGQNFKVTAVTQSTKGIVEIGLNGVNVLYTPDPGFVGADSFTYTITDTLGATDTATVSVIVQELAGPPIASDDQATVNEDSPPTVIAVLVNDSDPDGGTFKITSVTQGNNGTVAIRPGQLDLVYQPNPNFRGTDTFTYTITDNDGTTDTAIVTVTVVNTPDPPDAQNDVPTVSVNSKNNNLLVLANDLDADGDPLTITNVTAPLSGTAMIAPDGKSIFYTPNTGLVGNDVFKYTVTDPSGLTDTATVLVTVMGTGPGVIANDDVFTTPIGVPVFFGSRGVLANDIDPQGDAIVKATMAVGPANGTAVLNADGSFTYTSNPGFIGADSFTYTAFDWLGASDIAKATINVIDAAPAARNDAFSVQTNSGPTFINVLDDDADPEGKPLRIIGVTQPRNGKVTIVPGGLIYEPNPGFEGIDEFTYTVSDDEGDIQTAVIDIALVTLFVHGLGVPYFPMDDDFARPEDTVVTLTEADLVANDYNPSKLPVDIASVSNPVGGAVVLNGDGSVMFTPTPNFVGFASFNYKCAAPLDANMAKVEIELTSVLDPPTSADDAVTVNEDSAVNLLSVLSNDVDVDGDLLLVSAVTQGAHGIVAIGLGGANVTYTPQPNYFGSDTFTYTVSDGNDGTDAATVTVTVVNVDSDFHGTAGDDVFLVRSNGPGTHLEVFPNDTGLGTPIFSALVGSATSLLFDTLAGNDRLIVDLTNGSPLPTGGIDFLGGGNTAIGDQLIIRNGGSTVGSYLPSATLSGEGVVTLDGRNIDLTGVEPIQVSDFASFTAITPNANDVLAITQPDVNTTQLAGTSGGVAFSSISFSNIGTFIIDAAANDAGAGNDALTITGSTPIPNGTNFLEYRSGTGTNMLDAQSGVTRIDSTVAAGGTLDTTVGTTAELVTHRFRQTSLTLAAGSNATVLSAGTLDAVSRLNALNVGTGATLDINDNALVLDYTGASPEATIRAKIIEGRGGVGIGNGNWNGTGITSGAAAAANATDPESRSIGYADNSTLPLGAYTTFRGQPVDATSVLIAFTRTGDANLDSLVNDDDATILGAFYPSASATWATADFDYTQTVDDNDATLLGAFYDPSATPFPAAAPQLVSVTATDLGTRDAIFAAIGDKAKFALRRRR
jgi:hypothetical protein